MNQSSPFWDDELRPDRENYQVKGNLLHNYEVQNSSAEKQKEVKYFGPHNIQGTLEGLVSTLPSVLSRQPPSMTSASVPLVGETFWTHQWHTQETSGMGNITMCLPVH